MFTSKHMQYLQRLVVRSCQTDRTAPPDLPNAGLTLLECLVAIAVIGLVVSTITPAMLVSVATRIQSQKAEQAIKVAQTEIDQVRALVERGSYTAANLPQSTTVTSETKSLGGGRNYLIEYPQSVLGPVGSSTLKAENTAYTDLDPLQVKGVDVDGDSKPDFAVQVYRSPGRLNRTSNVPVNFTMGVRVYDIAAFGGQNTGNLPVGQSRVGVASGEGERGKKPLAVLYTSISKGDAGNSYCDYFTYLGSTPTANFKCD